MEEWRGPANAVSCFWTAAASMFTKAYKSVALEVTQFTFQEEHKPVANQCAL